MMRVTVYQLEDNALLNPPCFPTSSHHGFTEYFTVSIALQELNQLHVPATWKTKLLYNSLPNLL